MARQKASKPRRPNFDQEARLALEMIINHMERTDVPDSPAPDNTAVRFYRTCALSSEWLTLAETWSNDREDAIRAAIDSNLPPTDHVRPFLIAPTRMDHAEGYYEFDVFLFDPEADGQDIKQSAMTLYMRDVNAFRKTVRAQGGAA